MNKIIDTKKTVLDHGFIRVVDLMGEDFSIVQAARVSYGSGTKTISEDRSLIRYLMRHRHTSPFEMCDIKLHIKMPMCIGEQWLRHRTASINKISARYSILEDEFYIPDVEKIGSQSKINKQCRDLSSSLENAAELRNILIENSKNCYENYKKLIEKGVPREIARMSLPSNIYTEFYWKCNLHNLLHLVKLRSSQEAQYEVRVYSHAIEEIVKEWVPLTYEAYIDYIKESLTLSRITKKLVNKNNQECDELGKTELFEFNSSFNDL